MRDYADQRGDRGIEITSQMGSLGDYYGFILGLTGSHNPRTLEQIYITHKMAGHAVMIPKHNLACRRPDQLDGRVMPMIPTPGHGTFPSGHATEAFAIATVLSALVHATPKQFPDADARVAMMMKQAERIAVNRTVAGVHYPIDGYAGATLGTMIGRTIVALGNQQPGNSDNATSLSCTPANTDFNLTEYYGALGAGDSAGLDTPVG